MKVARMKLENHAGGISLCAKEEVEEIAVVLLAAVLLLLYINYKTRKRV